ncbi:MAG: 5'-nucleotidase C-terminal domain-containing protein [Bergeyella zoohelcum]|nr:5'-nucleotidase C-terminal domain-containing protein [Bergeyella zoohelcum]
MKNKFWLSAILVATLLSCKAPMSISQIETQNNIKINESITSDATFTKVIEPYKQALQDKMNEKISHTSIDLTKNGDNSNLGNLLADYTLNGAKEWAKNNNIPQIDAAVVNIGGIRNNIHKGDILLRHIFEVMPFENELVVVKMKGSDLHHIFTYYLETQKNNPVSGFFIETENGSINKALINGKEVDKNANYYIATSDYLALGGDNMKFFSKGEMITTGLKLRDLYIGIFRKTPEVIAPTDTRLIFKK